MRHTGILFRIASPGLALAFALPLWPVARAAEAPADPRLPSLTPVRPYVGSRVCGSCHEKEHTSWHRTYHRTMTQVATPESVAGKFDGTTVLSDGLAYRVFRRNDQLMAEMPDPDIMMYVVQGGRNLEFSKIPRVERPVVMATGSHHYQTYWVASERYEGLLQTLPLVYLLEDRRWAPREEAFMRGPDDRGHLVTQWNHHCIRCHATGGNPGLDDKTGQLKTQVAELGIACEACHGPGEAHVKSQRLRQARGLEAALEPNASIVNPARLDHRKSSQVCGQCHGVYVMRDEFAMAFAHQGPIFHPGDDLDRTRYYMQHPRAHPTPQSETDLQRNPSFFRERWWDDGTILAGGREYTALLASKCYTQGEIACVSCHSMHKSDPVDQLKEGADDGRACVRCHQEPKYNQKISQHTFHSADSPGSNCLNCHMPFTTYALFKGIRSHQIISPSVEASARFGTPNACNLCHLDKTLAWTQKSLAEHYGKPALPLTGEQKDIAASLLWLLQGNAAQRAIAAWNFGWEPAKKTSGAHWPAPFLSELLSDPYGVVRYVAARSLRTLPGFADFPFDFLARKDSLAHSREAARELWKAQPHPDLEENPAILIGPKGAVRADELKKLLDHQDQRSVTIKE